jgi:hypothetical protein
MNLPSPAVAHNVFACDSEQPDHHDYDLAFIRKMDERHASH